ncbi:MAG: hypothetical protein EBT83_03045 [Betaproteobacteria bacterium]|nr:hypothetical protein [Betaproteobacteria bacterium]
MELGGEPAFLKVFHDGERPKLGFAKPSVDADARGPAIQDPERNVDPSSSQVALARSRFSSQGQVMQRSGDPRGSEPNAVPREEVPAEEQQLPSSVEEQKSSGITGHKHLQHASNNLAGLVEDDNSYDEFLISKYQN